MELHKIESLLEKYFRGETDTSEENSLKTYFASDNVESHLKQYKSLFTYFADEKKQTFDLQNQFKAKKSNYIILSIAASVIILLSVGTFTYFSQNSNNNTNDLGTYKNPEQALIETQKALAMLSNHVNVGVKSIQYIEEYDKSKDKIFKK